MRICIPTLLCLLFLLASLDISHQCEEDEKAALLSFKSFLTDPLGRLSSWRGQNCCDWAGVRCSNSSQVVAVDLRNPSPDSISRGVNSQLIQDESSNSTSIKGTISPSLFTLRHLEYLDLSYNNFQLSRVPPQLSSLKNLAYLNFSNSNFSDSVSTQLANLSSLQSLDLSCSFQINDFSSVFYNLSSSRSSMNSRISYGFGGYVTMKSLSWLRGMVNLKELRLNGVDLSAVSSGSNWAEPISFLYDLRRLSLSDCQISGPVPMNQFLNLTRLSSLQMGFNFFASPIPTEIANFSSLAILDLTNSNIKGSLTSLPPLEEIYLDNNDNLTIDMDLIFSVPRPHLQKLSIMYTNTFGPIPSSISNASSLVFFAASSNSIQGPIPNSFTNLSNLQYLDLSFNSITGHLPTSIDGLQSLQVLFMAMNYLEGPIPESICKISSLEGLHFGSNNLNGTIPNCISEIPNLSTLYLGINNMEGTVTSILSLLNSPPYALVLSFSGLTVQSVSGLFPSNFQPYMLGLSTCKLSGKIPEFISNLTQVVFLDLSNNNLTGSIPSWIFKLPKLGYLDLSRNHLQGTLPPSVQLHLTFPTSVLRLSYNNLRGPIPYLTQPIDVLDLSWNNFSGEITAQVGEGLAKTRSISLSENKLSGLIPQTLCQPNNSLLKSLDLSKNQLTGLVPSNLGNCKSLIFLNLGTNNLTGRPPNELNQVKSLKSLQLHENQFEGPFPNFIKHLQDIEVLILGNNIFQGEIPAFVGELRSLRLIVLKSNNFNGSIPMQITHLRNLQFLDISHNKLSGPIPDQLIHLETMIQRHTQGFLLGYIVSLVYNGVGLDIATKGNVHEVDNVFSYLTGIDLSSNFLQGKIPTDFGLLQGLYMLNLSRNHLSGEIPVSFGDMRSLESLDLSFNGLTGGIPATLTNLDFLTYLNLSHNGLGGRIPVGDHFDTLSGDGGSAYVGNSRLCGPQVNKSCRSGPDEVGDVAEDDDVEWVNTWLFYGFVGQGYVFGMCGLFGILAVRRVRWWDKYWTSVDEAASRIIEWTTEMRSSS